MLKYKDIVKEPNDILTQKCAEVTFPLEKEDINNLEMIMEYIIKSQDEEQSSDFRPGITLRNNKIMLEYYDMNGHKKEKTFTGFAAIVVQHENDHLDGILFHTKIASPLQASLVEKAIKI